MSNFANAMRVQSNQTRTENGGIAYSTTKGGALLDLYAKIGGMRKRDASAIISDWRAARAENPTLADNLVLYTRNIRDCGLGERRIGRILLKELGRIEPQKIVRNLQTIVDTGRWDDLFIFVDGNYPVIEAKVWEFISKQLKADAAGMSKNAPISILAKWMPSINTSSQETRKLGRRACRYLGLTERTYRKTLSALRAYLDVVERKMSAGKWDEIDFESVPSVAMSRYIKTYNKRCQVRFAAYKAALEKGVAKVNAATLYPYDITEKYLYGRGLDPVDEAQWKALPNYVTAICGIIYISHAKSVKLTAKSFIPSGKMIGRFLPLGISSFLTQISIVVIMGVMNNVLVYYGAKSKYGADIPLTVVGIVMKVFQIVVSVCIGIAAGSQPVIGYNYGAGEKARVKEIFFTIVKAEAIVGFVSLLLFEIFPLQITAIFGSEDGLYNEFAVLAFRLFLSMIVLTCIQKAVSVFLQALGKPVMSMGLSLLRDFALSVPLAIILPIFFGVKGALFSAPIADIVSMIAVVIMSVTVLKELSR